MSVALLQGAGAGVQAMSARRVGEGLESQAAEPLNAALVLVLIAGLPLGIALFFGAPYVFPLLRRGGRRRFDVALLRNPAHRHVRCGLELCFSGIGTQRTAHRFTCGH